MANSNALLGLCAIRAADEYTLTHSMNTCMLSICFARYLGLDEEILPQLGIACLLHDVGKMFVPDEILNKPGPLTRDEWEVMENHTFYGARFLMSVPNMPWLAPLIAYEHHMKVDGSGYPRLDEPYEINLVSQMVALADFYDALTTTRPYKRAVPPSQVYDMMVRMEDEKIDPRLKRLFLSMIGPYPIGSLVRLDTGELGVVCKKNNDDPKRPTIRLITDSERNRLEEVTTVEVNETDEDGRHIRTVEDTIDPTDLEIDILDILQSYLQPDTSTE